MSGELTPFEANIREHLVKFTRKEPYITNTARRIAMLMPDDIQGVSRDALLKRLNAEYKRGYSSGYQAGKRDRLKGEASND